MLRYKILSKIDGKKIVNKFKSLNIILLRFSVNYKTNKIISLFKEGSGSYFLLPTLKSIIPGMIFNKLDVFSNTNLLNFFFYEPQINSKKIVLLDYKFGKSNGSEIDLIHKNKETLMSKCKLPSGSYKFFHFNTEFLFGKFLNNKNKFLFKGKANYKNKMKKSIVRGVAMNPVDHPHGGRTKTNQPEVSKWGWIAKHGR